MSADPETCPHPPRRLYLNAGRDALGDFRIVSCCDCGTMLGDLRELPRAKRAEIARHLGGDPVEALGLLDDEDPEPVQADDGEAPTV